MSTNHTRFIEWLKNNSITFCMGRKERIFVTFDQGMLRKAIERSISQGFTHLITVTGLDVGTHIELIYHLANEVGVLSIKTLVSKPESQQQTISDILPAAAIYEREVHDLLGIKFQDHPNLVPLLLPDDWPQHVFPLRSEWSLSKLTEKLKES